MLVFFYFYSETLEELLNPFHFQIWNINDIGLISKHTI